MDWKPKLLWKFSDLPMMLGQGGSADNPSSDPFGPAFNAPSGIVSTSANMRTLEHVLFLSRKCDKEGANKDNHSCLPACLPA